MENVHQVSPAMQNDKKKNYLVKTNPYGKVTVV